MRVLLLCVLLLLVGSPALAANWYVDDDAAGGGDGSLATPFQTIQAGVTAATSAGDSVLILPGTYAENVATGAGDDMIISGRSGDPTDVIWQPTGTTETTTAICLVMTTGASVTVEDLTFKGTGGDNQSGYTITADNAEHVVKNVIFDTLSTGFYMYNTSTAGTMTAIDCVFQNPSADATSVGAWGIAPRDATLTVTGCTFNVAGTTGEAWTSVIDIVNANSGSSISNSVFIADQSDQRQFIDINAVVTDLTIEGNTFIGGNSVSSNYGQVSIGNTSLATIYAERVLIRNNKFSLYGHNAIYIKTAPASTGAQMHKDIVVTDNQFSADGATENQAVFFGGVIGGYIGGNRFAGGDVVAAITLKGCRFVQVVGNDIRDSDNGVVIVANSPLTNSNQFGCSIVGNYFKGTTADGAIKIDNYDSIGAAAAPNDSLLTVAGNVFDGVTVVAKWVNTSNSTSTFTTLADYQNASTGWLSKSSVDRGNVVGSSDAKADWPFAGGGLNTIGVSGKGLIK